VPLPGEQMPGHAARRLDQRRRPWRLVPRHESGMRNYVRAIVPAASCRAGEFRAPVTSTLRTAGTSP
jgi:hypothetical protein